MTTTMAKEFLRLIGLLQQTDPSTTAYHALLQSIELLNSIGQTIEEMLEESTDVIAESIAKSSAATTDLPEKNNVVPFTAPAFPEEVEEEIVKEETIKEEQKFTSAQVRKALVDARNNGTDVRALLAEFGADNFSAIPEGKYAELMSRLSRLGA